VRRDKTAALPLSYLGTVYAASGGTPPAPQNAVANGGGSQPYF